MLQNSLRVALVAAFLALESGAFAQSTAQPTISLPGFVVDDPADMEIAHQISRAIANGLRKGGSLAVVETGDEATKTNATVNGRVLRRPDGRIEVQTRLWDATSGTILIGHQYTVEPTQWRLVADEISDSIHERLIGNPSPPARARQNGK